MNELAFIHLSSSLVVILKPVFYETIRRIIVSTISCKNKEKKLCNAR
jgi:hypothetical protein